MNGAMNKGTLLVVGAAGDVGQGIVGAALASGRQVIAAGRNGESLERIAARYPGRALACVVGDIATEAGAAALWDVAAAEIRRYRRRRHLGQCTEQASSP